MISSKLKNLLMPFSERLKSFYEYDSDSLVQLKESLRHIEIIRVQITDLVNEIKESLDNLDSEFIYSIITDSYYFEKYKSDNIEWKINFIRITWSRLLDELGISIDPDRIKIKENMYTDETNRENGRYIYKKYNV